VISVLLYGRNDNYGYNLHKRAVISLNCIAEVLDDPDDEIVFVDYNTPDDLPTFIEAIADTLTERARRLLRVLRVRPSQHARFAGRTHLKALESPARNAAIRRSNPNNRWILSANTDMVFIPRSAPSLSAVAAALPDGFYHTARFELPEILWETLDRTDPRGCIEKIERWGRRLQLQEVVYGTPITLFDGPGDFQLMLRDDVVRIHGFDERMLLGWHVDSNIAKRLGLLRSEPVKSALDHVLAYHCDHTREATPAHAHGAFQNDWHTFVSRVRAPQLAEQRDSWGFAGEPIEELRVDGPAAIPRMLEKVVPPMPRAFYVTGIDLGLYQDLRYDPEHVVPYLANVIGALPRSWSAAYAGCRNSMFRSFVGLWKALGFTGRILVSEDVAGRALTVDPADGVAVVPEDRAHAQADFFVFEIGASQDDALPGPSGARETPEAGMRLLDPGDHLKVRIVHRAYVRAIDAERTRAGGPRRFVLINMQNNPMDSTVEARILATWTPTGTHVRHGFVLPDPFALESRSDPVGWLEQHLRGPWRPSRSQLADIASKLAAGAPPADFAAYMPAMEDLLGVLTLPDAARALGTSRENLAALTLALEERRPSRYARERNLPARTAAFPRSSLSRMIAVEDFDDPDWGRVAVRVVGVRPYHVLEARGRLAWECTHLVYALERTGALSGSVMLLRHPKDDEHVVYALTGTLMDWAGECAVFDATGEMPGTPAHEAVVVTPCALTVAGAEHVPAVMAAVDASLKAGGTCVLAVDVALDEPSDTSLDLPRLAGGVFAGPLERETLWRMRGPLELDLSARTLDSLQSSHSRFHPAVRYDDRGRLRASCLLVFEKTGTTEPAGWHRYYAAYLGRTGALAER
jgi:GT2 family glycosyltransferase